MFVVCDHFSLRLSQVYNATKNQGYEIHTLEYAAIDTGPVLDIRTVALLLACALRGLPIYYHGTPLPRLPNIMDVGLLPSEAGVSFQTRIVTISRKMYVQVPGVHEFTTPGIYVTDTFTVALHYATPTRHRDIDIRKVVLANRAPFHHLLLWRALSQADARPHVCAVRASSHCNPAMELKVGISVQHEPGAVCCIIHSV